MSVHYWFISILILISTWIVSSAYFVNVEYTDGYALIINTQYFLGQNSINPIQQYFDRYLATRMPLGSILLIPAEWLATYLQLPAFDVRLHHFSYSLIHVAYIWTIYVLLRRYYTNELTILIAFLATIPNFIFCSYVPFLSLDVFPGIVLLLMVLLTQKFTEHNSWQTWILLVLISTCALLLKYTYALFWIIIIMVYGTHSLWTGTYRTIAGLIASAFVSVIIAWVVLSITLIGWDAETHFLLLPYFQIMGIIKNNPTEILSQQWWFYFKNFAAGYGILTTLLIIPGIVLAIGGKDVLLKRMSIVWILAFFSMIVIPYREVRYLAFLAPLSAFVIVGPIQWMLQYKRLWLVVSIVLLIFDLMRSIIEASIVYNDFFASNPIVNFFNVVDETSASKRPIFMPEDLSFTSQSYTPLAGDKLHRVFQIYPSIIVRLYNNSSITAIGEPRFAADLMPALALERPELLPNNTVLLLANNLLYREMGIQEHYFHNSEHTQIAAFVERVEYKKINGSYVCNEKDIRSQPLIVIRQSAIMNKRVFIPLNRVLSLDQVKQLGIEPAETIAVYGFRVTAQCQLDKCSFF